MKKMKRFFTGMSAMLLAATLLLSACDSDNGNGNGGGGAEPAGASGFRDVIRVGIDVDVNMLDPRLSTGTGNQRVIEAVFDGLIELDANLVAQPVLATHWENPDPLTWIFHLREGVYFSNGQPFGARDVAHTIESMVCPEFNSPGRSHFIAIEEVVIIDDHTVQFNLSSPFAPLLSNLERGIVPYNADEMDDFPMNPIGTGPYMVTEVLRNNRVTVVANPNYWGEAPVTPTIVYYIIPDNTVRIAALEAGDIDLVHSPLSPMDIARLRGDARFEVIEMNAIGLTFLNFNQREEFVTGELAVRRAIAHMIDRDTIANNIYMGMDLPAHHGGLIVGTWSFCESVQAFPFDPPTGQQFLIDAGFEQADNGFFYRDGERLVIQLTTHSEDPNRIMAIEFIQQTLNNNGIEAHVTTFEWATFFSQVQAGNYEIALLGLVNIVDPDRYFYLRFRTGAANNEGQFSHPDLDEAVIAARQESDQAVRAELYQLAAQIVNDYVGHHVLLNQGYIVIYNTNLTGFVPKSSGSWRSIARVAVAE